MWQDYVISGVQFAFTAAMMPVLFRWRRGLQLTSLMTAAGLTLIGVCFLTLGLWLSMAGVWSSAAAWWVLAWMERKATPVVSIEDAMAWGEKFEAKARHEEGA